MEKEKVVAYVKYGLNLNMTKKQVKKVIFSLQPLYIMGTFCGVIWGGIPLILGIAILLISGLTLIPLLLCQRVLTLKRLLIVFSIISAEGIINVTLFNLIFCYMLRASALTIASVILIPYAMFFLYLFITKKSVKKGAYQNVKQVKKDKVGLYALLGGTVGIFSAKAFLQDAGQEAALTVLLILFLLLAIIFAFCMGNILKVYYVNKFALTKDDLE